MMKGIPLSSRLVRVVVLAKRSGTAPIALRRRCRPFVLIRGRLVLASRVPPSRRSSCCLLVLRVSFPQSAALVSSGFLSFRLVGRLVLFPVLRDRRRLRLVRFLASDEGDENATSERRTDEIGENDGT